MKNWRQYRLGDFLERQQDSIIIDSLRSYKRITIKSKGQGIILRDEVPGIEIGTKNQFKVKHNQFLLSKIDAMNGAFGIVPLECDEGIITGNFWAYNLNEAIIDREYLRLLCIKQDFTKFSIDASEGTTNRKYLREKLFLNLPISLPSLPEQKSIVFKIGKIQKHLFEIRKIRVEQTVEFKNLLFSKYTELIHKAKWLPLGEIAPIVRRPVELFENASYPELGIRCFGKGTFHKPALTGIEIATKKIFQIKEGDLVFSNVFAWEGAIAVAKMEDNDRYGSHRFISCAVDGEKVLADFLCYHFLSPKGLQDINECSPGGAGRNKTLGLAKLMKIKVPVPDRLVQEEFVHYLSKIDKITQQHTKNDLDIIKLIPALLNKELNLEYAPKD